MAEVLGLIGSVSQIASYISNILASIQAIRNELLHAPQRIQQQKDYLTSLLSVLDFIGSSDALVHSTEIEAYLRLLQKKIDQLQQILAQNLKHFSGTHLHRFWKATITLKAEAQILRCFTALENDKTNLILYITATHGVTLQEVHRLVSQSGMDSRNTQCQQLGVEDTEQTALPAESDKCLVKYSLETPGALDLCVQPSPKHADWKGVTPSKSPTNQKFEAPTNVPGCSPSITREGTETRTDETASSLGTEPPVSVDEFLDNHVNGKGSKGRIGHDNECQHASSEGQTARRNTFKNNKITGAKSEAHIGHKLTARVERAMGQAAKSSRST